MNVGPRPGYAKLTASVENRIKNIGIYLATDRTITAKHRERKIIKFM